MATLRLKDRIESLKARQRALNLEFMSAKSVEDANRVEKELSAIRIAIKYCESELRQEQSAFDGKDRRNKTTV